MTSPSHITPPASVSAFFQAVSLATNARSLFDDYSAMTERPADLPDTPAEAVRIAMNLHALAAASLSALESATANDAANALLGLVMAGVDPAEKERISREGDRRGDVLAEAFARVSLAARGANLDSGAFPLAGDDVASLQACAEAMRKALDEISETARFVHRLRLAAASARRIISDAE